MTTENRAGLHLAPAVPSDLGMLRTIMAADRTLMAWIRTALSMLSFGFTIYKFLESVAEQTGRARTHSPQEVGVFLAGLGTASMVLGTLNYWMTLRDLRRTEEFRLGRPVLWIALVISIAGVVLFFGIAARMV